MLTNLLPSPLHPAVVHFPIVLTFLAPLFAVGALVALRRGATVARTWGLAASMLAALSLSAFVSLETGEEQEDRVEAVVPERAFEGHEDAAKAFFALSLVVLAVSGVGLLRGRAGAVARYAATVGSLALVVAGYRVGHSGGELVYTHGAASAYAQGAPAGEDRAVSPDARRRDEDDR